MGDSIRPEDEPRDQMLGVLLTRGAFSAARVGGSLPDAYRLVSYIGDNGQTIYILQGWFTWTRGCAHGGEWRILETQDWLSAKDDVPFDCLGKRPIAGAVEEVQQTPVPSACPPLAQRAYIAFVQICKGNSDDAGTYEEDERLVRAALERLHALESPAHALPLPQGEVE